MTGSETNAAARGKDDRSAASTLAGQARIWPIGGDVEARGAIARIAALSARSWRIEIGAAAIGIELPEGIALPLAVGDEVEARARATVAGIHPLIEGTILCDGRVRVAISEGISVAGWDVRTDGVARVSGSRVSSWVRFDHERAIAIAADGEWRELDTKTGHYAIWARASGYLPGRPLPPDASASTSFAIVLLDGAP